MPPPPDLWIIVVVSGSGSVVSITKIVKLMSSKSELEHLTSQVEFPVKLTAGVIDSLSESISQSTLDVFSSIIKKVDSDIEVQWPFPCELKSPSTTKVVEFINKIVSGTSSTQTESLTLTLIS